MLEFNEDSNTLDVTSIYSHPNEVWALETSPTDPSLLITSENGIYQREGNNSSSVNLYKMSNQTEDSIRDGKEQREAAYAGDQLDLEILAPLPLWNVTSFVHDIKWNSNNSIITSDSQYVSIYSVDNESINMTGKVKICNEEFNHSMHNINSNSGVVFKDSSHITSGGAGLSWDPHHADMCAVAANKCELKLIDTREGRATMAVKNIHKGCIR